MVDALDSKSSIGNYVWVRVPPSVPQLFTFYRYSGMVELVDTQVSEACGSNAVRVQVSFPELFFLLQQRFLLCGCTRL